MLNLQSMNRIRNYLVCISICLMLLIISCQSNETDKTALLNKDLTEHLPAGADIETIAEHLIHVRKSVGVTRALALHYPNLDKEKAYKIQMVMLTKLEEQGEVLVGWKMGGARVTDPNLPFEPAFGFMLASDEFQSGGVANNNKFAPGSPLMEAEVGFVLKKDLTNSTTSRDEVIEAIESIGGFCELISVRTRDAKGGIKATSAQFIADGMSHGGFIQPSQKYSLDKIDLSKVSTQVMINGKVKSNGDSKGFAFIDAVLFLANALPKYGRHLHSGDIIITGSMLTPPPASAGDKVEIKFSDFETLNLNFE
ncbi:MAG: hypothetical protein KAI45_05210 [Melioribacteraceae bacterium]|nr:hypothetical protein [Melioribacteraceae bacterium]